MSTTSVTFTLASVGASAEHVRSAYRRATAEDRATGLSWYRVAHGLAEPIGHGDVCVGAGILAALSPQIGWSVNVSLAQRCARTRRFGSGHYRVCLGKAKRIHKGEAAAEVLHGPKERAFYCNILRPGACPHTPYCVTVDRHIISAVCGRVLSPIERRYITLAGAYAAVSGLFVQVAAELKLTPDTLQAIVWVVWRREQGI
jgi:hypothetical protein